MCVWGGIYVYPCVCIREYINVLICAYMYARKSAYVCVCMECMCVYV